MLATFCFVALAMVLFALAVYQWMRAERLSLRTVIKTDRRRRAREMRTVLGRLDHQEKYIVALEALVHTDAGLPSPTANPFTKSEERHIKEIQQKTVVGVNAGEQTIPKAA